MPGKTNSNLTKKGSLRRSSTLPLKPSSTLTKQTSSTTMSRSSSTISGKNERSLTKQSTLVMSRSSSSQSNKMAATSSVDTGQKKTSMKRSRGSSLISEPQMKKMRSDTKITPKRLRKKPVRLQSFETPQITQKRKSKDPSEQKVLYYKKGDFLAVKSDEGDDGFFLCQAAQNVFKSTKQFMIRWLEEDGDLGMYKSAYYDFTELDCILIEVPVIKESKNTYRLPDNSKQKVIAALSGHLSDSDDEDEEPRKKKRRKEKTQGEKKPKTPKEPKKKKVPTATLR